VRSIAWPLGDDALVRTFTVEDADELARVVDVNAERLDRWFPWVDASRKREGALAFIERSLASETDLEGNGIWAGGEVVGAIGLSVNTAWNSGELGYWLDANAEGRGLVTVACRLFIAHGFRQLGLNRITIHSAVENERSRAVAERLGFTQEGVLRRAGRVGGDRYLDLVVYGLLHDEWPQA
jgi:ribosomal-protein-serine acetyltransferase